MGGKGKGRFKRQHHVAPKRQRGFPAGEFEYPGPSQETPRLTMQQEARNTERHAFARSAVQLRHHQVSFVSAGNMLRDDLDDSALETVNQSLKDLTTSKQEPEPEDVSRSQHSPVHSPSGMDMSGARSPLQQEFQTLESKPEDDLQSNLYFIDLTGDEQNHGVNHPKPYIPPRSPTPTDSSEDEVVFVGRNKSKARQRSTDKWTSTENTAPQKPMAAQDTTRVKDSTQGIESRVEANPDKREADVSQSTFPVWTTARDFDAQDDPEIGIDLRNGSRRRRRRGRRPRHRKQEMDDEDLILADYIANMQNEESSEDQSSEASITVRPLAPVNEVEQEYSKSIPQDKVEEEHTQRPLSWSSNDLDDFNNFSTSDDVPEEVGRIFSKRRRGVEIQYLVTGKNQVPDEARWILKEHLIMTGAGEQIKVFEETERSIAGFPISSKDSDGTSTAEERVGESDTGGEDFLVEGKREDMSDEQLARLLEKQERFGLAADDWDWTQNSDFDDDAIHSIGLQPEPFSRRKKGNKKTQFPSAGAFADALDEDPYRGFDIMDFDRPSLRKKPKRGRRTLDFDLSDSDMEWNLQQAWENDRTKKKAKKREREELRAQGLLGKPGKRNVGPGYSYSMSTDDVKDKIRAFLLSSSESLSLPPMDKKDRKLVHDLANAVSLKSQSRGNGASRFPMLYKTARTLSFDKKSIDEVDRIFSARRLMRHMGGGKKMESSAGKSVKPRRSGASAAASYMDGEVVGASAPEIGIGNKGRAMLEKMGWSTGTALGTTDNKGILQPLAQVVKNTKAGLG